jgi:hypothetical protein
MEGRHGERAMKPAFRQFIDAFAVQLGKSTAQGLVAAVTLIAVAMLR